MKFVTKPQFQQYLSSIIGNGKAFYEGFLGSASVTLWVATQYPHIELHSIDADVTMGSFWRLISEGKKEDIEDLKSLILSFPKMKDKAGYFYQLRELAPTNTLENAWRGLFFNRTTFSGIAKSQPIGGRKQISQWKIDCRYNAPLMVKKIELLRTLLKGRMTVTIGDAVKWVSELPKDVPLYLDPPYWIKGDSLYTVKMSHDEHVSLASVLRERRNWVLSYDNCNAISDLYSFANIKCIDVRYCIKDFKTEWEEQKEYLIYA